MAYRIMIDRNKCQGIGACVAAAPAVFDLDKEGKAIILNAEAEDDETLLYAAEACPLEAIKLYDEDGEQVYP